MKESDPDRLQIKAAKGLTEKLITTSNARDSQKPDLVTVISFNEEATTLYDLGDPSGAISVFDSIMYEGNTIISRGISNAIEKVSAIGHDPTANRSGIIVLTDGVDEVNSVQSPELVNATIAEIELSAKLGIRVSFGFLKTGDTPMHDPRIRDAIDSTGGIYSYFGEPGSQEGFIKQIVDHGITALDQQKKAISLFPGGTTSGRVKSGDGKEFVYTAGAGEKFNVTVRSEGGLGLTLKLRGPAGASNPSGVQTDSNGVAFLESTATAQGDVSIDVKATNPADSGRFMVRVDSVACGRPSVSSNGTNPQTPTYVPFQGMGVSLAGNAYSTAFLLLGMFFFF